MKKYTILSLGHSNRKLEEFMAILKNNKVEVIIDARTHPFSRFCPHYSKNALWRALEVENILYLWRGNSIGGKGLNVGYEDTIDEVSDIAKKKKTCLLCAEKDFKKCHRHTMLAPSFEKRGFLIAHL